MNTLNMDSPKIRFFHWAPRILCIAAILFTSLFAFDSFEEGLSVKEQILGFLMHLLPQFALVILLIVAWKYELVGGIIFSMIGLVLSVFIFLHNYGISGNEWWAISTVALITFPFLIVGILFILSFKFKKEKS